MKPKNDALNISLPFSEGRESVNSSRYYWDNTRRSIEQFVIIQCTLEGCGMFQWEGRQWKVPAGHAFIAVVPEPSAYYYPSEFSDPWKFDWLNFYGPLGVSICQELRRSYGPVLPLPIRSPAAAAFHDLVERGRRRQHRDPHDTTIACFSFVMEWKRHLDRPASRIADPVETAQKICETRFRESLGIKELAEQTGLSREHLSRLFMDKLGMPPARYLRGLRVAAARLMLEDKNLPLKEVALRCGFPSVRSLHRALSDHPPAPGRPPENGRQTTRSTRREA